jgi:Ribosomal RNA adenine dimethylase
MLIGKKIVFLIRLKVYFFLDMLKSFRYYKNYKFFLIDISLSLIYLFFNPYSIRRKYLQKKEGKKIFDYGETSLVELEKLIKPLNLSEKDTIVELGSGRGRVSFWLSSFYKAKVIAIEQVNIFCKIASFLTRFFKAHNLMIINQDMFDFDFENIDYIYFYGTTLEDYKIKSLIEKLKKTKRSIKIITISYSLSEYDNSFILRESHDVTFPWGRAKAFFCTLNQ